MNYRFKFFKRLNNGFSCVITVRNSGRSLFAHFLQKRFKFFPAHVGHRNHTSRGSWIWLTGSATGITADMDLGLKIEMHPAYREQTNIMLLLQFLGDPGK